jgi:hypothetical protein
VTLEAQFTSVLLQKPVEVKKQIKWKRQLIIKQF